MAQEQAGDFSIEIEYTSVTNEVKLARAHKEVLRQLSHEIKPYLQDFWSKDSPKCSGKSSINAWFILDK